MKEDVFALLRERLETALGDLPRCRVRIDALKIGMFLARLAPRDVEAFAFATTIQDHPRFQRWCGSTNSTGEAWTRQRIRSCRDALVRVGFLIQVNVDTVCYFDDATKGFRDTPNHFRFGSEYGETFALAISPTAPSPSPDQPPSIQDSSVLTPAIRPSRVFNRAPLVVVLKDRVIMGRVRSDIIRSMVARREAARDQHRLPMPMPSVQTAALAGMTLSAAAASIFKRRP